MGGSGSSGGSGQAGEPQRDYLRRCDTQPIMSYNADCHHCNPSRDSLPTTCYQNRDEDDTPGVLGTHEDNDSKLEEHLDEHSARILADADCDYEHFTATLDFYIDAAEIPEPDRNCPICHQKYASTVLSSGDSILPAVRLLCGHHFCQACIVRYTRIGDANQVNMRNTCPMCRACLFEATPIDEEENSRLLAPTHLKMTLGRKYDAIMEGIRRASPDPEPDYCDIWPLHNQYPEFKEWYVKQKYEEVVNTALVSEKCCMEIHWARLDATYYKHHRLQIAKHPEKFTHKNPKALDRTLNGLLIASPALRVKIRLLPDDRSREFLIEIRRAILSPAEHAEPAELPDWIEFSPIKKGLSEVCEELLPSKIMDNISQLAIEHDDWNNLVHTIGALLAWRVARYGLHDNNYAK